MKHTGDYELDEINMLEQECADLEEENKRLEEENKRLKEDLAECDDLREELDYRKREAKRLGWTPEKAKKQYKFMEEDTLQELRDLGEI